MKKQMNVSLYWVADDFYQEGGRFSLLDSESMDGYENAWRLLATQPVEFEVNEFDPREALIDSLKTEKAKVIAEATRKAEQLEEKIQQLLALDAPEEAA